MCRNELSKTSAQKYRDRVKLKSIAIVEAHEKQLLLEKEFRDATIAKLKRLLTKLLILIRMLMNNMQDEDKKLASRQKIFYIKESDRNVSAKNSKLIFNLKEFRYNREKTLTPKIKAFLQTNQDERSDNMVKISLKALTEIIPQLQYYPYETQKTLVRQCFYEEYEPGRVISRQGHPQYNYYFILSGTCLVTRYNVDNPSKDHFVDFLKNGHTFGHEELFNNCRRESTVSTHGENNVCFISVSKADFFRILKPLKQSKAIRDFMKFSTPLLNQINYPVDSINFSLSTVANIVTYRTGALISGNSYKDEWIYIVKCGTCKVLKEISIEKLLEIKNRVTDIEYILKDKNFIFLTLDTVRQYNYLDIDTQLLNINKSIFLEIEQLHEGDIFGLRDKVFFDILGVNPVILVSEGVECILISKKEFFNNLTKSNEMRLRGLIMPYPTKDRLVDSYLDFLDWREYKKHIVKTSTIKNFKDNN